MINKSSDMWRLPPPENSIISTSSDMLGEEKKNRKPVLYTLGSLGAGLAGVFEGVYDVVVGTTAQLTGNEAYADYLHKTAVVGEWKQQLDEEHNPGKGMKFIGDVASGIGQSSALLLEGVAPGLGWAVFGTGVAGGGISEAYQKTGELGAKEYIYGASRGLVEAALEKYVGAGGQMVGNLAGKVAPSLTGKVVSALAAKTASQAAWKGVAKSMISAGAGEFVEEFLGDYIDVALQRVTGVDKEASTTLKEAVYSGLVGLVSGAIMGGVTKSINVGMSYRSGSKVAQNGNAETLIKTAKVVADSFQTKDAAKLPETLSQLKDAVAQYENTTNKESATAKIKLGEIKTYLAITEVFSGVQDVIAKIDQSDAKPYAEYMSDLTGKTVTVEDFKADKDNVKTNYAVQAWAALFLKDSKAEKATRRFNDIIQADKEGRPAPKGTIEGWSGEETVISLGQEYVNIIKDGAKYNVMWGQSSDNVNVIKGLSQAEVKTNLEYMRKYFEAREAEVQTAREIYNATEQDAARDVIRDFDTLSPETRGAVIEWVKSAQGLDRDVVSAVSFIMSVRPGLQVLYAELGEGHKGLYANLPEVGRRLIVTSGDAKAVRETIAHELTHDLRQSKGWDTLKNYALRTVKESERQRIEKLYTDTLGLGASAVEEEVVAKVVGKALSSKVFLQRYAQKHKLVRIAQTIKQLAQYFKTKGADKLTLKESYALMSLVDGIIKTDYVKGIRKSDGKADSKAEDESKVSYSLKDIDGTIKVSDESVGAGYGQIDYRMTAEIDGEYAGYLSYSVADKTPYVNMIETKQEYRRRGVATTLLQALQKKYNGIPINFGMRTEDGSKLIPAITEEVKNPNYSAWHAKRVMNLSNENAKLNKEYEINYSEMRDLWKKSKTGTITEAERKRYDEVMDKDIFLRDEIRGNNRKIYDLTKNLSEDALNPTNTMVKYNLTEDSEGNTLTLEQQEFFKDSKVRDKDGRLLVVYHGTNKALFSEFDTGMVFATDSLKTANAYAGNSGIVEPRNVVDTRIYKKSMPEVLKFLESNGEKYIKATFSDLKADLYKRSTDKYTGLDTDKLKSLIQEIEAESISQDESVLLDIARELLTIGNKFKNNTVTLGDLKRYAEIRAEAERVIESQTDYRASSKLSEFYKRKLRTSEYRSYDTPISAFNDDSAYKKDDIWIVRSEEEIRDRSREVLNWKYRRSGVYAMYMNINNMFIVDAKGQGFRGFDTPYGQMSTDSAAKYAREHGYDGALIKRVYDTGRDDVYDVSDVYVAFSPEQVKSVDNLNPTSDPDIRYSLKDSAGRELTPEQAEFFKDSKVRDADGNLLVVYHGTNAEFNVFDKSKNKEGNDAYWFSRDRDYSEEMAYVRKGDRIVEAYINLTNPLTVDMKPDEFSDPTKEKPFIEKARASGYDGVIFTNNTADEYAKGEFYAVFSPSQIKLTTNKNPTQNVDIRYDLADSQVKKYKERAEYWKSQVTQDEIANADEVRKIARKLKTAYNSKYKTTAQELSALYDYMAKDKVSAQEAYEKAKSIAEGILSESYELSPEYETYRGIRAYVMGSKLKVNDTIKGDIADYNDWRKHNAPFVISDKGIPVDIAYMELSGIYGAAYFPDIANPTDQLLHIVDQMANSKNKMVPTLFENFDAEAAYIAESIIDDYQAIKQPTYRGKQAEKFNRAMMAIKVIANADRAKNLFKSKRTRGILAVPEWNELTKLAKDVRPRFNINVKNARLFAGQFAKFITRHGEDFSFYVDSDLADKLLTVAQGNGALTAEDMAILNAAYYAMFAMDSRVDRIYKDGKWVDTEPDAKQAMDGLHDQYEGKITKGMANNTTRLIKYIVENALDPEDATRTLEGVLSGGVLSKSIHEIKLAYERAEQAYDRYTKEAEEFIENNKDFWKSFNEDSVELKVTRIGFKGETVTHNLTLTKGEAMQLYMTTKREQAKAALALGRIRFDDQTKRGAEFTARILKQVDRKVYGDMTDVEFQEFAQVMYDNMALAVKELEFSETDKKFIEIMEKFYNGLSKEEKAKMDDIRWGKTNVIDSYYVPLTRSSLARDINLIQPRTELMTVRSYSFNKDTVQGANAQLVIGDAYQIFKQHARQLSKYVELTIPLENFQRIYNYKFEDGTADVYSVREYLKTYVWDGVDNYYKNYLQDVQGTRARDDTVSRTFQKVKGAFAKAAIGANVSSFLKQFSSTIMMMTEVDFDSWVKGIRVINADVMDKYSMLAANRNSPNAQYYAQGATGRLGKIGQATMWLMKKGDRSACYTMWSMCQHQAAKEGLALGTEENFVRAGELLNDAILSVQDTGSAPTKSGIARSPQEAVSALTMFRSAPIKMASKTFIAAAEYKETLRRRKAGKMTDADVSGARKKLQRVLTAITAVALFEAVVGVTLAKLRGKYDDEEEEKIVEKLTKETALNLVGLVPVIGQIAESWLGGYESSFFYYDILNDGLGTLKNFYDMGTNIISGEVVETATWMRNLRKLAHFFGTATGIPVRNIDNHLTMVIRSVSPGAAYKYNALFYDTGMTQTLRAAIAKGKDGLALAVLDNLYSERTGKYSREISEIQADLYKQGYNVVPSNIPKTYKVGDEELNVTPSQYKRIKELYSEATVIVAEIIQKDEFKKLEPEAQAKVIRTAYNSALDSAKHQVLGTEMSKVSALLGLVDPVTLLLGYSYITTLTGLKADRAKAYVRKYDKFTQAAILYSAGYSTIDIKNTLNKTIVALDNGDEILKALGI